MENHPNRDMERKLDAFFRREEKGLALPKVSELRAAKEMDTAPSWIFRAVKTMGSALAACLVIAAVGAMIVFLPMLKVEKPVSGLPLGTGDGGTEWREDGVKDPETLPDTLPFPDTNVGVDYQPPEAEKLFWVTEIYSFESRLAADATLWFSAKEGGSFLVTLTVTYPRAPVCTDDELCDCNGPTFIFTPYYSLQYWENGEWVDCPWKDGPIDFPEWELSLSPGETYTTDINLFPTWDLSRSGTYRLKYSWLACVEFELVVGIKDTKPATTTDSAPSGTIPADTTIPATWGDEDTVLETWVDETAEPIDDEVLFIGADYDPDLKITPKVPELWIEDGELYLTIGFINDTGHILELNTYWQLLYRENGHFVDCPVGTGGGIVFPDWLLSVAPYDAWVETYTITAVDYDLSRPGSYRFSKMGVNGELCYVEFELPRGLWSNDVTEETKPNEGYGTDAWETEPPETGYVTDIPDTTSPVETTPTVSTPDDWANLSGMKIITDGENSVEPISGLAYCNGYYERPDGAEHFGHGDGPGIHDILYECLYAQDIPELRWQGEIEVAFSGDGILNAVYLLPFVEESGLFDFGDMPRTSLAELSELPSGYYYVLLYSSHTHRTEYGYDVEVYENLFALIVP